MMSHTSIAIIGAGLAGLHTARLLRAANIDFVLIEARDRIGGRILSADDDGRPSDDGFDLGPSWFWPHSQPAIANLIDELGLSSFAQYGDGDVIFERMLREGPQRYHGDPEQPRSFRLAGGTASLVRALASALLPAQLQLGAQVTAMTLRDDGIDLTIRRSDGHEEQLVAAHVIAAVPPRLLEATVAFTPALDAQSARRWRSAPTWMAPHAKFVAVYDRPFWRAAGLSGTAQSMVGPMPEIHDATTASEHAALFGFVGVSADQRAVLGDHALTRACIEQFARLFGAEALHPRATLLKDWAADPLTATATDRVATGHVTADKTPWVTGHWQARLALAGSETSPIEPGYLAGAVVAAARAVDETLRKGLASNV